MLSSARDACLQRTPDHYYCRSERILISLPQDHCLAAREIIYWTDLRNEKILLSEDLTLDESWRIFLSRSSYSHDDRPGLERHDVSAASSRA